MHLPTYLALIVSAVVYSLYELIILWQTNWFLFAVSVYITLATVAGSTLQSFKADSFEFKWMIIYTLPFGLLVVSGVMQTTELSDSMMQRAGFTPVPHIIPGTSMDYENAAYSHYVSMAFPAIAWLLSWLVQFSIDYVSKKRKLQ